MDVQTEQRSTLQQTGAPGQKIQSGPEHVDVLIVGAGISGIGGAYHLTTQCPGTSFTILEAQESFGGTWLTHRYPGIRSDSDLFTFGYRFKPWVGAPIATGAEIMKYLNDVIAENNLARHIRYGHKIVSAHWSSDDNLWTVEAISTGTGEPRRFTANFLYMCQGYYKHAEGYTPDWPGMADFKGQILHPQTWPAQFDGAGKKVIVIGSGATAATIVPALAENCAHVTMLQRSPTYFIPAPNENELANTLRELEIDESWIHEIVRRKMLHDQNVFTRRTFTEPDIVTQELLGAAREYLGPDYDIATHFTPGYRPWRQRIAFLPDGDLFRAVAAGKASVVTAEIDHFTGAGIQLKNGQHLDADIIVTATGFRLSVLGDIAFTVDGREIDFADTINYRGMMFTGVPNLAWVFGYFRASWTLRADLVGDFVCRLINHMKAIGARKVTTELRPQDRELPVLPWIDPENFNPGYLMRDLDKLPKRLDTPEWQHTQDYAREKDDIPAIDLEDATFVYEGSEQAAHSRPSKSMRPI
jgi:cation diffusion facilitator CzcD-associated flavoprotein CzcO